MSDGERVHDLLVGRGLAAVQGNTAEAPGPGPLLLATVEGPLTISDNRWLLAPISADGGPVILAQALAAIVASNYIEWEGKGYALDLGLPSTASYTVLGNIASGAVSGADVYTVNNGALPGPWDALNVTTP